MKDSLIQKVLENKCLKYINEENGKELHLSELDVIKFEDDKKKLAFIYVDNSITSIALFWSLMRSKHCFAMLSPSLNINLKLALEKIYKPKYIFDDKRNEIQDYEYIIDNNFKYFKIKQEDEIYKIHDQIKLLLSTSGTTGSPKFVKLSEANLIANATSIINYLPINSEDVTPLNLPIYYSYGLSILISNSISGGKIVCSNDDILSKSFWQKFEIYKYTSIAGVPFLYEMLDRIGFTKKKYPSLKYFTQAGGKLNDNLILKFAKYAHENGIDFFVMYGQTEATARMAVLAPYFLVKKLGSIGKPILDGQFFIDSTNNELIYEGPNVFGGYAIKQSDLMDYSNCNVLKTGDIARVDIDGFFFIIGRLNRFIKLFGNRINLDELEYMIHDEFKLIVKCAGFNDKMIIIFSNNKISNSKDVLAHMVEKYKLHPSVLKFIYVDKFPLTVNGKIDYNELLNIYGTR